VLEGFLVGIIDASLLRKAMQSCSGVDRFRSPKIARFNKQISQYQANIYKTLILFGFLLLYWHIENIWYFQPPSVTIYD
jgi:hypothetical protein